MLDPVWMAYGGFTDNYRLIEDNSCCLSSPLKIFLCLTSVSSFFTYNVYRKD
jgi:hypothetical protein